MNSSNFIQRALELGYSNLGNVSPNPSVGVVIVKNNQIIAEGITQPPGSDHAEINAIKKCTKEQLNGASLYLTLEPCCHTNKRTPPCTVKLIKSGIKEVIIGTTDKNPAVAHNGINTLNSAGIKTTLLNDKSCEKLHEFFFHWITTKRPFVTIKAALTKNYFMTWGDGIRKKITDETASAKVHELRRQHDAILIGINTLLKDDPQLNVRLVTGRNPLKIVLDSILQTPLNARIFNDGKTIIYCSAKADKNKLNELSTKCDIVQVPESNNRLNLSDVLIDLGKRHITSVLVEGGVQVIESFIKQNLANKCIFFITNETPADGKGYIGEKINYHNNLAYIPAEFTNLDPNIKFRSYIPVNQLKLKGKTTQIIGNSTMIEGYL